MGVTEREAASKGLNGQGRTTVLAALLLSLLSPQLQADTVFGIYAGAGGWRQEVDGDLRSGLSAVDVEDDLGTEEDTSAVAYFALEHGVPVIPNVRVQYTDTSLTGAEVLTRSIEVNGTVFSFSDTVSSDLELTQADAVFYYELLDNVLSLDLGVAARFVDGQYTVASSQAVSEVEFDGVLPMLYGAVRVDLPLTGMWVGAQAQGMGYQGDQLVDLQAQIGYQAGFGLGLELGWRSLRLELDDFDDLDQADIEISGPFLLLNYHF